MAFLCFLESEQLGKRNKAAIGLRRSNTSADEGTKPDLSRTQNPRREVKKYENKPEKLNKQGQLLMTTMFF